MFHLISSSFHIEQFLRLAQWLIYFIKPLWSLDVVYFCEHSL